MFYSAPENVVNEIVAGRSVLHTPQNGRIVVDATMLELWRIAQAHDLPAVIQAFQQRGPSPAATAAGLFCLVKAGLLLNDGYGLTPEPSPQVETKIRPSVSAVIVAYNGLKWLPECLNSLLSQSLPCFEIIVVDNASSDDTGDWLQTHYSGVQLIKTSIPLAFAQALNLGISESRGDFLLPLNQDTVLDVHAVADLVAVANSPEVAAVAPCLRLMRTPAFLNGLGNQARAIGWGTDNYIGYLDLGQFGTMLEIPSICLAAALISRQAWEKVGPLDEGFPMYYEDIEWSYRARLKGFRLVAAPQAVVYHDFGGSRPSIAGEMTFTKLQNVIYGRLRFTSKLMMGWQKWTALMGYAVQDGLAVLAAVLAFRFKIINAYQRGWAQWLRDPPQPLKLPVKRHLKVFSSWREISPPRIWRGMPELTWESICSYYLPLISSGSVGHFPELDELQSSGGFPSGLGWRMRLSILWQDGGLRGVLRDFWRRIRWALG